jgi:hypothetical protein
VSAILSYRSLFYFSSKICVELKDMVQFSAI